MKKRKFAFALLAITLFAALATITLCACFGTSTVISFDSNGGTKCEDITVTSDMEEIVLPSTERDGYDFTGWYTSDTLTEQVISPLTDDKIPASSVTYYAGWQKKIYTITFVAGDEVVETRRVEYGGSVERNSFPSLDEYPGYEWQDNSFKATYNRTVTAVAIAVEEPDHTITYYIPSGDTFATYRTYTGKAGDTVSVPANPSPNTQPGDVYFKGWYYDAGRTRAVSVLPTAIGNEDISFYAGFETIADDSKYLFYEERMDGGINIIGFNDIGRYKASISIPSEIDGKPVLSVGKTPTSSSVGTFTSVFLTTVVLPSTLREIGDWAFLDCTALSEVVFGGDELTEIGKGAFAGCTSLAGIELPQNVTIIKDYAFAGVSAENDENDAEDREFISTDVEGVGTFKLFKTSSSLNSLTFAGESKLSYIGDYAFYNCSDLRSVTLGKVMRDFNYKAFYGSGIENIDFAEGGQLKGIGGAVYSRAETVLYYYPENGAEECVMPASVTTINDHAFYQNKKIKNVVFSTELTSIDAYAFYECSALETVPLGNSKLAYVHECAFARCSSLTSVAFPAQLLSISSEAFKNCSALSNVTFRGNDLEYIGNGAFYGCTALSSFYVPDSVAEIGDNAFYGCASLAYLTFGNNSVLEEVGSYAFYDCTSIGEILLPESLKVVGDYSFSSEGEMNLSFNNQIDLSNVTYLGEGAFMNTKIETFTISAKIAMNEDIGKYVFKNCTSLKQAYFSATGEHGYDTVPEGLFYGCTSLNRILLTNNIKIIDKYAFYNCTSMETVQFSQGITEIREYAFSGCISLTNPGSNRRVLPAGLTTLGKGAFYYCRSLASINVPAGLVKIEADTFAYCDSLSSINYDSGTTLNTIGENAFAYCTSLTTALLPETLAVRDDDDTVGLVKNPFFGCTSLVRYEFSGATDGTLYVNNGVIYRRLEKAGVPGEYASQKAIYAYPTAKNMDKETVSTDVSVIDRYAYYGCLLKALEFGVAEPMNGKLSVTLVSIGAYAFAETQLNKATVSYRVYEVGESAFAKSELTEVVIENDVVVDGTYYIISNEDTTRRDNVLSIGGRAFTLTEISEIEIPSRVSAVLDGAFSKNYSLSSVSFAGGDITPLIVGDEAFAYDNLLTEMVFPASVAEVGAYALYYCNNVGSIRFVSGGTTALTIDDYAFSQVHYLYDIYLPSNIYRFGSGIFEGDTRLKYVYFADDLTGANDTVEISDYMFYGLPRLTSVTIPAYVTRVGTYAFVNTSLEEIVFLGTETDEDLTIGDYAFAGLDTLTGIALPANLTAIGDYAFYYSGLREVAYGDGKDMTIGAGAFALTGLPGFECTDRVVSIGEACFSGMSDFTYFRTSGRVTEIPEMAFLYCEDLSEVVLTGITGIAESAFAGCALESIVSDTLCVIGKNAFLGSDLRSIVVNVTGDADVSELAFEGAEKLVEVRITATGNITVGEKAFENCINLEILSLSGFNVSLGIGFAKGANSLGEGFNLVESNDVKTYIFDDEEKVLYNADGHTFLFYPAAKVGSTFVLNDSVTEIADYAFYGNKGLTGLVVRGDDVIKGENTFEDINSQFRIYVATDRLNYYVNEWKLNNIYSDFTVNGVVLTLQSSGEYSITGYLGDEEEIELGGTVTIGGKNYEVTSVGDNAFRNNTVIRHVTIGSGIKTVSTNAFRNCTNLEWVRIGENVTSVKSYAFCNCDSLTEVVFTENGSLLSIGNYAFSSDVSLERINVPAGVEAVGIFAFAHDVNLTEVTFGEGLTEIGSNAFEDCVLLPYVVLPASLTKLGGYVFSGCEKLIYVSLKGRSVCNIEKNTFTGTPNGIYYFVPDGTVAKSYKVDSVWRIHISKIISEEERCGQPGFENYVLEKEGDGYKLVAYLGTEKNVTVIHEVSDTVKVTSIGEYAIGQFAENVILDEGIEELKERAFYNATSMKTIVLPSTLITIGSCAFQYLNELTSVTFNESSSDPSNLSAISDHAFYACYGLTTFTVPAMTARIGAYAFSCPEGENMNFTDIIFKHNAVSGKDSHGNQISLTIEAYAFARNDKIKDLEFKCRVVSIGEGAFLDCVRLGGFHLKYFPDSINQNMVTTLAGNGSLTFKNCESISVFVPTDTVKGLYSDNNTWFTSQNFAKLIPEGNKDENGFVFFVVSSNAKTVSVINYLGSETEIVFPSETQIGSTIYKVERIGRNLESGVESNGYVIGDNVTSVVVPSGVKTISRDAFRNSKNLTRVTLSDTVVTIDKYAFAGCENLTYVNIPVTVKTIDQYAFYGCKNLVTVNMEEAIEVPAVPTLSINGYAFAGCTSLTSFYVPNHLKTIGTSTSSSTSGTSHGHVFEGCESLTTVTFSAKAKITSIGPYVFANTAIKEIHIPESVESIADYGFANCTKLRFLYFARAVGNENANSVTTAGGSRVFDGVSSVHLKIYVPYDDQLQTYNQYNNLTWGQKTIVVNKVTPDNRFAYSIPNENEEFMILTDYRGSEKTVTIPRKIMLIDGTEYEVIGIGPYFGNETIEKVVFPNGSYVSELEEYAFAGCTSLKEIHLPDGLTLLGRYAFSNCTALDDVTIPGGVTKIEANTFYFCSSLEEVVIPENVESIGANAFGFCESLARVIIKFGGNLERSKIGDALEDSAFEGAGQKPGGLTLIVPGGQVYGLLLNGWGNKSSVMGKIHSEESLIGDFVADTNEFGTALILVQYVGYEDRINLSGLLFKGMKIAEVYRNSIRNGTVLEGSFSYK